MAKFVKNPSGTVHSVSDDFQLEEGWEEVTEAEASPQLLGTESDPEVDFTALREPAEPVIDESGPAQEPGQLDERESNDIHAAAEQVEAPAAETEEEEAK